eukprot:3603061-Amphidinium_carterae.1
MQKTHRAKRNKRALGQRLGREDPPLPPHIQGLLTSCANAGTHSHVHCHAHHWGGIVFERTNFHAYAIYSVFLTTIVYPIVVYCAWSSAGGFHAGEDSIADIGYYDFAGSGITPMTGGISAH